MTLQHQPHQAPDASAASSPAALPPLPPVPMPGTTHAGSAAPASGLVELASSAQSSVDPGPYSAQSSVDRGPFDRRSDTPTFEPEPFSQLAIRRPTTALANALRAAAAPPPGHGGTPGGHVRLPLPPLPGPKLAGCTDLVEIDRAPGVVTYRAWHSGLSRLVQLSVLAAPALDERHFAQFLSRRADISALSWHPHIQPLHDAAMLDGGSGYLVGEFLPFGSLGGRLAIDGALAWSEVVHYGVQIADALDAAHRSGVSHGGLDQYLLRLDRSGDVKLAGLGLGAAIARRGHDLDAPPSSPGDLADLGLTLWLLLGGAVTASGALAPGAGATGGTGRGAVADATIAGRVGTDGASGASGASVPGLSPLDIPPMLLDLIERLLAVRPGDASGTAPVEAAWLWGVAGPSAAAAAKELQRIQFELDLAVTPTYTGGAGAPTARGSFEVAGWTASIDSAPGVKEWGGWTPTPDLIWTSEPATAEPAPAEPETAEPAAPDTADEPTWAEGRDAKPATDSPVPVIDGAPLVDAAEPPAPGETPAVEAQAAVDTETPTVTTSAVEAQAPAVPPATPAPPADLRPIVGGPDATPDMISIEPDARVDEPYRNGATTYGPIVVPADPSSALAPAPTPATPLAPTDPTDPPIQPWPVSSTISSTAGEGVAADAADRLDGLAPAWSSPSAAEAASVALVGTPVPIESHRRRMTRTPSPWPWPWRPSR